MASEGKKGVVKKDENSEEEAVEKVQTKNGNGNPSQEQSHLDEDGEDKNQSENNDNDDNDNDNDNEDDEEDLTINKCFICSKVFPLDTLLREHIVAEHRNKNIDKARRQKRNIRTEKKTPPSFPCAVPECSEKFPSKAKLEIHYAQHKKNDGKKYCCEFCQREFPQGSDLRRHMKSHEDEMMLSGETLPEGTMRCKVPTCRLIIENDPAFMESHMRTHIKKTKRGTFICPCCDKDKGPSADVFETHLMEEHGLTMPTMYKCDQCDRWFTNQAFRSLHTSKSHSENGGTNNFAPSAGGKKAKKRKSTSSKRKKKGGKGGNAKQTKLNPDNASITTTTAPTTTTIPNPTPNVQVPTEKNSTENSKGPL